MSIRKVIQTLTADGDQLTPSGDPSIPMDVYNWEGMRNLNGSADFKWIPSDETATFNVVLDSATVQTLRAKKQVTGWSMIAYFRDQTAVLLSGCGIVNNPTLDGDGAVDVEVFFGAVRWL